MEPSQLSPCCFCEKSFPTKKKRKIKTREEEASPTVPGEAGGEALERSTYLHSLFSWLFQVDECVTQGDVQAVYSQSRYCSLKSSFLQQRCVFFCYIRGVYPPIYCVPHTSGPQDCSLNLKSPCQQQGCLFFSRISSVYSYIYCVAHSSQPQGSPTLKYMSFVNTVL